MRVYTARIELPDSATWSQIEDAKLSAKWKESYETDLENKCGSCIHFHYFGNDMPHLKYQGTCDAGHIWGQRSRPKCKGYERKGDDRK